MTTAPVLRSQPTRDRILAAARRIFAAEGYERTTVRLIAAEARSNPSLIIRYFGGKEALFAAVAEFDLRLPDLAAVPASERPAALVAHFLDRWEESADGGELAALLRASVSHPAARERLVTIFETQLTRAVAYLVGPDRAAAVAALMATQMLGLALTRYVLRLPGVVELPRAVLIEKLGATLQGYLLST